MKKIAFFALVVLGGVFAYHFIFNEEARITPMFTLDDSQSQTSVKPNKWFAEVIPEPPGKAISTTDKSEPQKLLAQFGQSRNLRAFIAIAKTKPPEGGLFLTKIALVECLKMPLTKELETSSTLKYDQFESHQLASDKQKALSFLQDRCSGISPSEARAELVSLGKNPNVSLDPLLQINKKLSEAKSVDQRESVSKVVLITGDPFLITQWGNQMGLTNTINGGKPPSPTDENAYGLT